MADSRIFFKATVVNTWEPIEFEAIQTGDKIKMVELSPDKTETLSEVWEVTGGYSPKTGVFEGNQLTPAIYMPANQETRELFKNANLKH